MYLAPPQKVTPSEQMFDADENRMIELPYGEKLWRCVKSFSSDTGTLRTDGQTDRQICYINIARQYSIKMHTATQTDKQHHQYSVPHWQYVKREAIYPNSRQTWPNTAVRWAFYNPNATVRRPYKQRRTIQRAVQSSKYRQIPNSQHNMLHRMDGYQ